VSDPQHVYVVDDDEPVRDSLAFLLTASGFDVETFGSAAELLPRAEHGPTGCIVSDIRMPEMTGLDLARTLRAAGTRHRIILITGHGDVPLAVEAMRIGVDDFIEKPFDDETIVAAIRSALGSGGSPDDLRAVAKERYSTLTEGEQALLSRLITGKTNTAASEELGVDVREVEVRRASIMTKMQAKGLPELVRMALLVERHG